MFMLWLLLLLLLLPPLMLLLIASEQSLTQPPLPPHAVENTRVPHHRRQKIEIKKRSNDFRDFLQLIKKARQLRLISSTPHFPALFVATTY